jgi:triosephosphate isomerase
MNKSQSDTGQFIETLLNKLASFPPRSFLDVAIAPSFTCLQKASDAGKSGMVGVFAQNVHYEKSGAFTGEISPPMLAELNCRGAIVGHSERRQYFAETDESVKKKVSALLAQGMTAIACVGETLAERQAGSTLDVVGRQVDAILSQPIEDAKRIVLAYEPVWAIGTGQTATPQQAGEVHTFIRARAKAIKNAEFASALRIIYGGSMNAGNAFELMRETDIDGGLIGGASLDAESFFKIIEAAVSVGCFSR